jgi:hypothetical protein
MLVGLMAFVVACGPEEVPPDGAWNVTISSALNETETGIDSTCIGDNEEVATYQASYLYQLYYDGDAVSIDIDGQAFAEGIRTGCGLNYESAIWLEERPTGLVTWRIVGEASYRGAEGGCDERFEGGEDWNGMETIEVINSEDETIVPGCTYNLDVVGTWANGG